eukprot:TRINITY_DN29049_c0_g1_i1.p1 TRINITY_DN29049_c0_g1~~TRINITY_DN29049_c0_g1_i1.p1  ORF type:complete len:2199 (+),score=684.27 TRINITY_DN29049_c0_g1_i1:2-6598(+)
MHSSSTVPVLGSAPYSICQHYKWMAHGRGPCRQSAMRQLWLVLVVCALCCWDVTDALRVTDEDEPGLAAAAVATPAADSEAKAAAAAAVEALLQQAGGEPEKLSDTDLLQLVAANGSDSSTTSVTLAASGDAATTSSATSSTGAATTAAATSAVASTGAAAAAATTSAAPTATASVAGKAAVEPSAKSTTSTTTGGPALPKVEMVVAPIPGAPVEAAAKAISVAANKVATALGGISAKVSSVFGQQGASTTESPVKAYERRHGIVVEAQTGEGEASLEHKEPSLVDAGRVSPAAPAESAPSTTVSADLAALAAAVERASRETGRPPLAGGPGGEVEDKPHGHGHQTEILTPELIDSYVRDRLMFNCSGSREGWDEKHVVYCCKVFGVGCEHVGSAFSGPGDGNGSAVDVVGSNGSPQASTNPFERRRDYAACFLIEDREECCRQRDGRHDRFGGYDCYPSKAGQTFSSGFVCEPAAWLQLFDHPEADTGLCQRVQAGLTKGGVEEDAGEDVKEEVRVEERRRDFWACIAIHDEGECCRQRDTRPEFADQECLPAKAGRTYHSGHVCEPIQWVRDNDQMSNAADSLCKTGNQTGGKPGSKSGSEKKTQGGSTTAGDTGKSGNSSAALPADGRPALPADGNGTGAAGLGNASDGLPAWMSYSEDGHIAPPCHNTKGWKSTNDAEGFTCEWYEKHEVGCFSAGGVAYNYPEFHCCVCGKDGHPKHAGNPSVENVLATNAKEHAHKEDMQKADHLTRVARFVGMHAKTPEEKKQAAEIAQEASLARARASYRYEDPDAPTTTLAPKIQAKFEEEVRLDRMGRQLKEWAKELGLEFDYKDKHIPDPGAKQVEDSKACVDSVGWSTGDGWTCDWYAKNTCKYLGAAFNFPEWNCCICGKKAGVTVLTKPAAPGDMQIQVASLWGFVPGQDILVGEESNWIVENATTKSRFLAKPLMQKHRTGTLVKVKNATEIPALPPRVDPVTGKFMSQGDSIDAVAGTRTSEAVEKGSMEVPVEKADGFEAGNEVVIGKEKAVIWKMGGSKNIAHRGFTLEKPLQADYAEGTYVTIAGGELKRKGHLDAEEAVKSKAAKAKAASSMPESLSKEALSAEAAAAVAKGQLAMEAAAGRQAATDVAKAASKPDDESGGSVLLPPESLEDYDCKAGAVSPKSLGWSNRKKEYCCRVEKIGCEDHYNCDAGDPEDAGWSVYHLLSCCKTRKIGCEAAKRAVDKIIEMRMTVVPDEDKPFNCDIGLDNWEQEWSKTKQDYCCAHAGVMCQPEAVLDPPTTTSPPPSTSDEDATKPKKIVKQEDKKFDCNAGIENWKKGYSDEKKYWCCYNEGIACEDPKGAVLVQSSEEVSSLLAHAAPLLQHVGAFSLMQSSAFDTPLPAATTTTGAPQGTAAPGQAPEALSEVDGLKKAAEKRIQKDEEAKKKTEEAIHSEEKRKKDVEAAMGVADKSFQQVEAEEVQKQVGEERAASQKEAAEALRKAHDFVEKSHADDSKVAEEKQKALEAEAEAKASNAKAEHQNPQSAEAKEARKQADVKAEEARRQALRSIEETIRKHQDEAFEGVKREEAKVVSDKLAAAEVRAQKQVAAGVELSKQKDAWTTKTKEAVEASEARMEALRQAEASLTAKETAEQVAVEAAQARAEATRQQQLAERAEAKADWAAVTAASMKVKAEKLGDDTKAAAEHMEVLQKKADLQQKRRALVATWPESPRATPGYGDIPWRCAKQHEMCKCNDVVVYAPSVWPYYAWAMQDGHVAKKGNGAIKCDDDEFGDPKVGVLKSCWCIGEKVASELAIENTTAELNKSASGEDNVTFIRNGDNAADNATEKHKSAAGDAPCPPSDAAPHTTEPPTTAAPQAPAATTTSAAGPTATTSPQDKRPVKCSDEGELCRCPVEKTIVFVAAAYTDASMILKAPYKHKKAEPGGILLCGREVFGDPSVGNRKTCWCVEDKLVAASPPTTVAPVVMSTTAGPEAHSSTTGVVAATTAAAATTTRAMESRARRCAEEGGTCDCPADKTVAYVAAAYKDPRTIAKAPHMQKRADHSGSILCHNDVFGDPSVGNAKACWCLEDSLLVYTTWTTTGAPGATAGSPCPAPKPPAAAPCLAAEANKANPSKAAAAAVAASVTGLKDAATQQWMQDEALLMKARQQQKDGQPTAPTQPEDVSQRAHQLLSQARKTIEEQDGIEGASALLEASDDED